MRAVVALAICSAAVGLIAPGEARAQCADYDEFMHLVSRVGLPGGARGVALSGSLAYVACDTAGLVVIDVGDPAAPAIVGRLDTPGHASDVAVAGAVLCVADRAGGLAIVDVSLPADPALLATVDISGTAFAVATTGPYAFVAAGNQGLIAVDLADPAAPAIVSRTALSDNAYHLSVQGDRLYVAGRVGLTVIDVTAPQLPVVEGYISVSSGTLGVTVAGDHAYLTFIDVRQVPWSYGLAVLDVTDPQHPQVVRWIMLPSLTSGVTVANGVLYVVSEHIRRYDLTHPAAPRFTGRVATGGGDNMVASGGYLHVAAGPAGLDIVDVSSTIEPPIRALELSTDARDMASVGSSAFIAAGWDGLVVANAVTGQVARIMPSSSAFEDCRGVAADGTTVALVGVIRENGGHLYVVEATDPAEPRVLGSAVVSRYVEDVALARDHAYVVSGDRGLTVIDISDPAAPTVVGYVDTPGWAQDVAVMGQLALVADGLAGLQVIDVSDPRQPRRLGELATGGNAVAVAVADSRVLVAAQQGGLVLVDVTDPGQPRMIASVDTWRDAKGVIVDDGFVYVLEGSALSALDVSDPSAPVIVGYVTLPWDVVAAGFVEGGICAIGRYLLYEVPGGWDQYRGRILSVPRQCGTSTPCSLARFEAQAVAGGVHLLWRFVADGVRPRFRLVADNGRDSWDIDWFGSGAADEYEALDTARWLDTGDEVTYGLYLQGDDSQWLLLGTTTARPAPLAGGPRLLAPVPNPFNPSTAIRYHLPAGGAVRVAVFDLAGRRVRTLVHDERPRGDHEAFWDGRDDSGREVGSGTYLVRLESGGVSSAVTVGLVR